MICLKQRATNAANLVECFMKKMFLPTGDPKNDEKKLVNYLKYLKYLRFPETLGF